MPGGRAFPFLSNSLEGSDKAAGDREGQLPPRGQTFLSSEGSAGALGNIRGDVASGAWCVAFPADAPEGARLGQAARLSEASRNRGARGGTRDGQLLPVGLGFREEFGR